MNSCVRRYALCVSLVLLLPLGGCTIKQAVATLKPTRFLTSPEKLRPPKYTPFDLVWTKPGLDRSRYGELVVAAVRTNHLNSDDWIFSASTFIRTRSNYIERVNELADYLQLTVTDDFKTYSQKGTPLEVKKGDPVEQLIFQLPDYLNPPLTSIEPVEFMTPMLGSLALDISITQADFGDPLIYGGLLAVPFPGVANLSGAVKSPSLTLEARFIDQNTHEVVAEMIDRRFPQLRLIDLNRLTVSSALREIVDSFSEDLVKSFHRKQGEKVGRRLPVSLLLW